MSFTPFSQLFLNVDDDGSLICDALGGPRLVITILRDGTVVENGIMGDSRVVYNFTASNNSFGNYTCIATIDDMEANESTLVVGMYAWVHTYKHLLVSGYILCKCVRVCVRVRAWVCVRACMGVCLCMHACTCV